MTWARLPGICSYGPSRGLLMLSTCMNPEYRANIGFLAENVVLSLNPRRKVKKIFVHYARLTLSFMVWGRCATHLSVGLAAGICIRHIQS